MNAKEIYNALAPFLRSFDERLAAIEKEIEASMIGDERFAAALQRLVEQGKVELFRDESGVLMVRLLNASSANSTTRGTGILPLS